MKFNSTFKWINTNKVNNLIFSQDGKFFFFEEDSASTVGPYKTIYECLKGSFRYYKFYLEGRKLNHPIIRR